MNRGSVPVAPISWEALSNEELINSAKKIRSLPVSMLAGAVKEITERLERVMFMDSYDPVDFANSVDAILTRRKMSQSAAAREAGVTKQTMCRILQNKMPTVENYVLISNWVRRNM